MSKQYFGKAGGKQFPGQAELVHVLFFLDPSMVQQPEPLPALGYLSLLSFGGDKQGIISLGACPAGNSWNQSLVFTAPAESREGRAGAHKSFLFHNDFCTQK